ncbi:hypothetical protein [Nocardioides sp. YIM 152588]|uniref:hypothetical protein n=1 Tax=Nocardioides sp. YIM 152588 TaxID=3158259 RepID=UPI0032E4FB61
MTTIDAPPEAPAVGYDVPDSPINWLILEASEARFQFESLDRWVNFLRTAYGLPPTILPPLWHRHDELIWELSALHQHWLNCYDASASPSAPLQWHQDFALARERLRDWVAVNGSRLDRDRPTRITTWPGERPFATADEVPVVDRAEDFRLFVDQDSAERERLQR